MDNKALSGLCILNTRPLEQGRLLSKAIEKAGGLSLEAPALGIKPYKKLSQSALLALKVANYAIFVSANAVKHCMSILRAQGEQWPSQVKIIAIGQATALALQKEGLSVTEMPAIADSEHVLALSCLQAVQGKTIVLVKGKAGRLIMPKILRERGAHLEFLNVYQRCLPQAKASYSLAQYQGAHLMLLTSQEAIKNIFILFELKAHAWLRQLPCLVFGSRLATFAESQGFKTLLICQPDQIIETLYLFNQGRIHERKKG